MGEWPAVTAGSPTGGAGRRPLKGAVVGCGMIAQYHLRAWRRIPEVEIVAAADAEFGRAGSRRGEYFPGGSVYASMADLLAAERLDFVDILTPPGMHREHCLLALDVGLHVVCQKPLAATLQEAREVAAAASGSGRVLSVHENHRYRPWFRELLRRAAEGFFGTIRYARFEQFDPREPAEPYKLLAERGVLLEYGTHLIDMVYALLGAPLRVDGSAWRLNERVRGESLVHLSLDCGEAAACIDIAWKPGGLPQGGVTVIGDRGEAVYEGTMTRGEASRFRLVQGDRVVLDERRSPTDDYAESFYLLQREAVDAWLGNRPPPQPAAENLRVLETTFAAYDALSVR